MRKMRAALLTSGCLVLVTMTATWASPEPAIPPPGLAQWADNPAAVSRMTLEEFQKRHAAGEILVLDVRSPQAYQQGHIPGAILIPLGDVEKRAGELKDEKRPIVTYCT